MTATMEINTAVQRSHKRIFNSYKCTHERTLNSPYRMA